MKQKVLSKEDVYQIIFDRINNSSLSVGDKIPPCRTLAKEMQSNISTVNRAIQQLAEEGIVRSEERKGSFIAKKNFSNVQVNENIIENFRSVIRNAQNAGLSHENISELFNFSLNNTIQNPKIAFVECNKFDLSRMSKILYNSTGIQVNPILIDDLTVDNIKNWDLISTPIFHISEVREKMGSSDKIIGLNFIPKSEVLNKIALLEKSKTVTVIAPTERGVERMLSLVRQYFPGKILCQKEFPRNNFSFTDNDVVITNRAAALTEEDLNQAKKFIVVDWELDSESAENFRLQIKKQYTSNYFSKNSN